MGPFKIEMFSSSLILHAEGKLGDGTGYMYLQTSDAYWNIIVISKKTGAIKQNKYNMGYDTSCYGLTQVTVIDAHRCR